MDPQLGYVYLGLFVLALVALLVSKFCQRSREIFLELHIQFLEDEIRTLLDIVAGEDEYEDEDESEDESENEPDKESSEAERPKKELEKP